MTQNYSRRNNFSMRQEQPHEALLRGVQVTASIVERQDGNAMPEFDLSGTNPEVIAPSGYGALVFHPTRPQIENPAQGGSIYVVGAGEGTFLGGNAKDVFSPDGKAEALILRPHAELPPPVRWVTNEEGKREPVPEDPEARKIREDRNKAFMRKVAEGKLLESDCIVVPTTMVAMAYRGTQAAKFVADVVSITNMETGVTMSFHDEPESRPKRSSTRKAKAPAKVKSETAEPGPTQQVSEEPSTAIPNRDAVAEALSNL